MRAQNLRTARPVNKNYQLLNILRNADVNKVGRPSSAVAELLYLDGRYVMYNVLSGLAACGCLGVAARPACSCVAARPACSCVAARGQRHASHVGATPAD